MSNDMNDERDPELAALFANAVEELPGDEFLAGVSAAIDRSRRVRRLRNVALAGLLILVELSLNSPVSQGIGVFAGALETTLVPVGSPWLELLLSPVNSLAGVVGLTLLGLHMLYRRLAR